MFVYSHAIEYVINPFGASYPTIPAIDLETDTVKVALIGPNTTVPNRPNANDLAEFALDEPSGTGYSPGPGGSGRKEITNKTWSFDYFNHIGYWNGDDVAWPGIDAGTIQGALVYQHNSDSDDSLNRPILWFGSVDGFPLVTSGNDFTLFWANLGIMRVYSGV